MSTTSARPEAQEQAPTQLIHVAVPPHSIFSELRAMRIVWRRDLIRFVNDRIRMMATLVQPLLFLFVLGSGLQQLSSATIWPLSMIAMRSHHSASSM